MVQLSHPYMTPGKTTALTIWIFVGKVMSLLIKMLSMFVLAFLPRSKCLFISWLQSPSATILEPRKIKSVTISAFSPSICHEVICVYMYFFFFYQRISFPDGSDGKESTFTAGDPGSIPALGRSPGEGNGYLLQYSYLIIPWTEEPGRLQLTGLQRVRHI